MVRARPNNDSSNAFAIDDDEDMDQLMLDAANSGSAAVAAEQKDGSFSDFDMGGDSNTPSSADDGIDFGIANDQPAPAEVADDYPEFDAIAAETPNDGVIAGDAIDEMLANIEAGRIGEAAPAEVELEPLYEPEPVVEEPLYTEPAYTPPSEPTYVAPVYTPPEEPPAYVAPPEPAYVAPPEPKYVAPAPEPQYVAPTPQPVYTPPTPTYVAPEPVRQPEPVKASHALAPTPRSLTLADQIALAQRIVATVDVYRGLTSESKDVVAQLLAPTAEDVSQDEGTVAIRAIYAEPIQESTQKALIEAKNSSPVDRVFYILALPKDVLRYLGELVQAYTSIELPTDGNELTYAKALVEAIDKLDREPIIYAEAMAKVLEAAQAN
jgi:hypothetical protein